jgi:epoxyqueuosine reductase
MKQEIKNIAYELGACACGMVTAEVFSDLGCALEKKGQVPMVNPDIQTRIDPFLVLPDARTIVVCLFSYYAGDEGRKGGNISRYARGVDYHHVVGERLGKIASFFTEQGYKAEYFSDNGPLNERYLALRAGLGFLGRNGFLIHPDYGTYTVIGYLVTNCPMEADQPMDRTCLECGACIRACPGGALSETGFCAKRCASYLTQKKGELTAEEIVVIQRSGYAWGCDICQEVCPHNRGIKMTALPEFREDLISTLQIGEEMSARQFRHKYQKRAFSWRGKATMLRNLQILKKE